MTRYLKTTLGAIATLGLALGASLAIAHSGGMGAMDGSKEGGMGRHGAMSGAMQGGGMHGGGMHGGGMGGMHGGGMAGQQLMTPQERDALREKMAAAKTPEERQALAAATRADMEKRAKEKGIALPEQHGRRGGMGEQHGRGSEHRH